MALSNAYQGACDVILHICVNGAAAAQAVTYDLSKQPVRDAYSYHLIPAGTIDYTAVTSVRSGVPGLQLPVAGVTISNLGHIFTINMPASTVQGEDDLFLPVRMYF